MINCNTSLQEKSLLSVWGPWAQFTVCQINLWRSCCSYFIGNAGGKSADNECSAHDLYVNGCE